MMMQTDWSEWSDEEDEEEIELVDTELSQLKSLGSKTVKTLNEHDIESVDDLEQACKARTLHKIPGFGKKRERKLIDEIKLARKGIYERKEWEVADESWQEIKEVFDGMKEFVDIGRVTPAGSYRRGRDTVGDLDILIESDESAAIYHTFDDWSENDQTFALGSDKMSFRMGMMQIDLEVVPTESYGAALMYFTGSKEHNMEVRGIAKSQGLRLDEWGLWEYEDNQRGERVAGKTEEEIYNELGLEYLEPEDRQPENVEFEEGQ